MSAVRDLYGLPVTTTEGAIGHFDEGVRHLLAADGQAAVHFQRALEADPQFAMAHFLLGREHFLEGDPQSAKKCFFKAFGLSKRATRREQLHLLVTVRLGTGDPQGAELAREYLAEYPRDILILQHLYQHFFFHGGRDKREVSLAFVERFQNDFGDDWAYAQLHAFALVELHQFDRARARAALARKACGLQNGGMLHALIHVHFETRDFQGGEALLGEALPEYRGWLRHHLWWHRSLCALELGQPSPVPGWYEERIKRKSGEPASSPLRLADMAQLLWRARLYGGDPAGLPLGEARDLAAELLGKVQGQKLGEQVRRVPGRGLRALSGLLSGNSRTFPVSMFLLGGSSLLDPPPPTHFTEMHAAMVFALAGDEGQLSAQLARLQAVADRTGEAGDRVALAVARGVSAFAAGHHGEAIAHLEPLTRQDWDLVGGSNVECGLLGETLVEAHLRRGNLEQAKQWLRQHIARDGASGRQLLWLGRAQAAAGELAEASQTTRKARELWGSAEPGAPELATLGELESSLRVSATA